MTLALRDSSGPRGAKALYYGRTKDASPSGLKIDSDVSFPLGSILTIKLQSPKTRRLIQATGKVKWVTPMGEGQGFEVGLEFVETSLGSILDLLDHLYKA